jgi:hypothetical protein
MQKRKCMRFCMAELSQLKQAHGLHITFNLDADCNAFCLSVESTALALKPQDQAIFSRMALQASFELLYIPPIFE